MKTSNDNMAVTDKEKADTLNNFFGSVFTKEDENKLPEISPTKWSDGKQLQI